MDYVINLTDEELTYICTLISGKAIKRYFQKNLQEFSKLRPGIQPGRMHDEDAVRLIVRYRNKQFVLAFINRQIGRWINEINKHKNNLVREGKDSSTALLLTLSETVLCERLDIYFKLTKEGYSEEYIHLAKSAVQLLNAERGRASQARIRELEERYKPVVKAILARRVPWTAVRQKGSGRQEAKDTALLQARPVRSSYTAGKMLPKDRLEANKDYIELGEMIRCELLKAGVSEKYAQGLADFMYAAYQNGVPLLLAGPCAPEIADAFSAALSGRLAARLVFEGDYCRAAVEQCFVSEDPVVVIENPFNPAWNRYLSEILANRSKFYMAVSPYEEDLLTAPGSHFSYMAPLLTECFVDRLPSPDFVGGYMGGDFQAFAGGQIKPYYEDLMTDMKLGPFTRNMLQRILTDMHTLSGGENADNDCIFLLLPYAYVYHKTDVLRDYLSKRNAEGMVVSAELLSHIRNYFG